MLCNAFNDHQRPLCGWGGYLMLGARRRDIATPWAGHRLQAFFFQPFGRPYLCCAMDAFIGNVFEPAPYFNIWQ